ncbi:MAG: hypothetical protein MHPSP_004309 [Paramarteilia canceri]
MNPNSLEQKDTQHEEKLPLVQIITSSSSHPKYVQYTNTNKNLKPNELTLEDEVNRKLDLTIGTSSAPNSFIENKFFVSAIKQLSPGFKLYNRKQISSLILGEFNKIKILIKERVEKYKSISICADFWSLPTDRFLGIMIHYYLDVIKDEINLELGEFDLNIDSTKLFHIITDNSSNMKAAFKKTKEKLFEGGEIDFDKSPYCELKGSFNYAESEVPKRLQCIDHALSNNLKAGIKK